MNITNTQERRADKMHSTMLKCCIANQTMQKQLKKFDYNNYSTIKPFNLQTAR